MPGMVFYQTDKESKQIPDFSYEGIPVLPNIVSTLLSKDVTESGTNDFTISTPADTNEYTAFLMSTPSGSLLASNWRSGDYTFRMRVVSGSSFMRWQNAIIHRIRTSRDGSGAGVSVESKSIRVSILLTTGTKTHVEAAVPAFTNIDREDIFCVQFTVANTIAAPANVTIRLSQQVETPIVKRWMASQVIFQLPPSLGVPILAEGNPVDKIHCQTPMIKSYCFEPLESPNVIIEGFCEQAVKSGDDPPHKLFPGASATWTKLNATSTSPGDGSIRTMEFLESDVTEDFIRPVIRIQFNVVGAPIEIVCELWVDQEWYIQEDPIFGELETPVDIISHQLTDDAFDQTTVFKDITA